VLAPLGAVPLIGWYFSSVLLRPVTSVDAEELWRHGPDPAALELPFQEVPVPGPLGDYPAWLVPAGDSERMTRPATWAIAVHGRGADRREALRVLPALHRAGLTTLVITYRNDVGAPASPDGMYHLGATEWADLAAAVRYASAHGATRVLLYGWSMGAAVIGAYLSSPDRAQLPVAGVIWDSPVLDWRATLRQQARVHRIPGGLSWLVAEATVVASSIRAGIQFSRFDLPRRPPASRPPTLVIHGAQDSAVPPGPGRELAETAEAGRLDWPVRYFEIPGAEHTAGWNVDPTGYQRTVEDFVAGLTLSAGR
jgi:hypothetical protein